MKCSRCGREISEEQSYVHQNKVFCEDCLMDVGLSAKECDPWLTYVDMRTTGGLEGLSEIQKKVYEFVKSKGKATREEVMEGLKLSDTDLKVQLVPLMHSELLKERSEGGKFYLFPIQKQD